MVTGHPPFRGEYEQAVIYAILNETPKPPGKAFPRRLSEVISCALAKDPAERYATAEELEQDLESIPLGGTAPVRARFRRRPGSEWKSLAAGLVALVVIAIALGAWYQKHRWDFSPEVALWMEQGDRLEWRGDTKAIFATAENAYRKALSLDRENPLIKAQLAALLCRVEAQFPDPDRRKEIRSLVGDAVERAPDQPMPRVAQAKLLLLDGKPKEAEEAAHEAVDHGSKFDRSYTMLGEALIAQGRSKEGFEMLRTAVGFGQGFLRAGLVYAYRLQDANRLEEAAVELKKVLEFDPDHPTANQNLGSVYLSMGRYTDALPLLKKAFEATQDPRVGNNLGLVYLNLSYLPEAIKAFRAAYRIGPEPTTARNLAECYEIIGQKEEARRWYEVAVHGFDQSLARGASRPVMLYGRSFCVAKLGRFDEALDNIREAMTLEPKQSVYVFRAAQIHAIAGHRQEAYSWIRRAIQEGYPREELRGDPAFRAFKDDPEFLTILESAPRRGA